MGVSEEYVKGFNNGYLIRKNHPVLAKTLLNGASGTSEYLDGLKAGSQECEKEWAKDLEEIKREQKEEKRKGLDGGMEM